MGYDIEIDPERKLLLFTAHKTFTREDFFICVQDVANREDHQPGFNMLVDLTSVEDFGVDGADIRKRTESDPGELKFGKCKLALVASKPLVFGMTRMYQILLQAPDVTVQTFQDMESAREWIGLE